MEGELAMTLDTLLSGVTTVLSTTVSAMGDNIVTAVLLGMGIVGAGAGLFHKLKKSSK